MVLLIDLFYILLVVLLIALFYILIYADESKVKYF